MRTTVAIQGELGSNSAQAAIMHFGDDIDLCTCADFTQLFQAVRQGRADYAMAPVENSLAGSIHEVWDLLFSHAPHVVGEYYLHVKHFLIGHPGSQAAEIRQAASHVQALAQCAVYLQKMHIRAVEEYDTAGAVALVKERGDRREAAIAPAAAAQLYGMEILDENIQTDHRNFTRFLVLSHEPAPTQRERNTLKNTLIFETENCASLLGSLLGALSEHQLSKVETRKRQDIPWGYRCYLECVGHIERDALHAMRAQVERLCHLTPYPIGEDPA